MILDALDHVRGVVLRGMAPVLGRSLVTRDGRVALRIGLAIAVAFVLAITAPAATLAISPLLLGVPHVASSIRYLVLRQKLPRWWLAILCASALVLAGLRVAEQYSGSPVVFARCEVIVATFLALLVSAHRRSIALAIAIVAAGVFCVLHPILARLAFVHVHNLAAVVIWAIVWRRARAWIPIALLALAVVLLTAISPLSTSALGVDLEVVGRWLVPGAAATIAIPLVLVHVFTDSVHYAFWLGIIPEETLRHEGTLTFRMTWRGLREDFGRWGLAFVIACAIGFLAFAIFGAGRARDAYFAIAGFHGYIEGVMLLWLVRA